MSLPAECLLLVGQNATQCPICKKNIGGGGRRQARGSMRRMALTCNTNIGVRIDPPGAQIDGDSGVQKIIGRVEPQPPGKSDPDATLFLFYFVHGRLLPADYIGIGQARVITAEGTTFFFS